MKRSTLCNFVWLALIIPCVGGCHSKPKAVPKPPSVSVLRMIHHVGGTHYRTLVRDDVCYQAFDRSLLVIPAGEVMPLKTIDFGKLGECGPAIDMAIFENDGQVRLLAVIQDDEVVELSLSDLRTPTIVERISAAKLGIRPRKLSIVDGEPYVSGLGGVVRYPDRKKIFTSDEEVSGVAKSDSGLIACVGRRAIRLADDRYVGSASDVQMVQSGGDFKAGTILFIRQSDAGAMVGLMGPDVRELDANRATVAVRGVVHAARLFGEQLWIASDDEVVGYTMADGAWTNPVRVDIAGARDVALLNPDQLAIAGTFGRTIYQLHAAQNNPAEKFVKVQREPSNLERALTDGQHILAGSREGLWMYLINSRVDLTMRQFENLPPPPATSAVVKSATAKISDDGMSVTISPSAGNPANSAADKFTFVDPDGAKIHCIAAVDGDFWVGHDRGITVLKSEAPMIDKRKPATAATDNRVAGSLRFDGPVLYIYPLLVGGGASFVSEYGGFGVAKFIDEPIGSSMQK